MPTLSELQQQSNDAEHQAFQRAYDALLNVAKDPITCRHFWDVGRLDYAREHEQELAIAYIDGHARGRESLRIELERQEPVAWISHDQLTCKDRYGPLPVQSLNPLGFKHTRLYAHPIPPPDVRELVAAADAVVNRWDSPLWSQQGHTGEFIARLRAALAKHRGQS